MFKKNTAICLILIHWSCSYRTDIYRPLSRQPLLSLSQNSQLLDGLSLQTSCYTANSNQQWNFDDQLCEFVESSIQQHGGKISTKSKDPRLIVKTRPIALHPAHENHSLTYVISRILHYGSYTFVPIKNTHTFETKMTWIDDNHNEMMSHQFMTQITSVYGYGYSFLHEVKKYWNSNFHKGVKEQLSKDFYQHLLQNNINFAQRQKIAETHI